MNSRPPRLTKLQQELTRCKQTNLELQKELSRERARCQQLSELSRTLDLERVLLLLDDHIQRSGLFDGYLIALHDPKRDGLVCLSAHLPAGHAGMRDILKDHCFRLQDRLTLVEAFLKAETMIVHLDDLDPHDSASRQRFEWWQATTVAAIPIANAKGVIGVLNGFRQQGNIDARDVQALEVQLRVFNEPLHNALLLEKLKQSQATVEAADEEHQRFLRFVSEINSLTSPDRIFEATLNQLLRAYQLDAGVLSLVEPDEGLVVKEVSVRERQGEEVRDRLLRLLRQPTPLDATYSASVYAFLQNAHVFIPDVDAVRHLPMTLADRAVIDALPGVRAILHMPIREHGRAVGMLMLMSERPHPLRKEELRLIESLASFVGTVIANAQLYLLVEEQKERIETLNHELQSRVQQLDEVIRRDPLTQLYNFGAFQSEFTRRVEEAGRHPASRTLAVVIIDIDHFKQLNDVYGHVAGNVVLREVAGRIVQASRTMDIPCRFGGEEFAVILPHSDLKNAREFAERFRSVVAQQPFLVDDNRLSVTVSLGCAQYQPGERPEELLKRADRALYLAKQRGRNRVETLAGSGHGDGGDTLR